MGKKLKILLFTFSAIGIVFLSIFLSFFTQNYYDPGNSNTPTFSLPFRLRKFDNVTGVQRFNPPNHIGLDFKLPNATEIIAPIGGKISGIEHHMMSNNLWIVDVTLRINPLWGMFIAFEPWTYEEAVAVAQQANISAYIKIGDIVVENQTLGWLQPVPASEFPHIHWTVYQIPGGGLSFGESNENVNPYSYLAPWAQTICNGYCSSFWDYTPC